jgi:hypothetical protein
VIISGRITTFSRLTSDRLIIDHLLNEGLVVKVTYLRLRLLNNLWLESSSVLYLLISNPILRTSSKFFSGATIYKLGDLNSMRVIVRLSTIISFSLNAATLTLLVIAFTW